MDLFFLLLIRTLLLYYSFNLSLWLLLSVPFFISFLFSFPTSSCALTSFAPSIFHFVQYRFTIFRFPKFSFTFSPAFCSLFSLCVILFSMLLIRSFFLCYFPTVPLFFFLLSSVVFSTSFCVFCSSFQLLPLLILVFISYHIVFSFLLFPAFVSFHFTFFPSFCDLFSFFVCFSLFPSLLFAHFFFMIPLLSIKVPLFLPIFDYFLFYLDSHSSFTTLLFPYSLFMSISFLLSNLLLIRIFYNFPKESLASLWSLFHDFYSPSHF